MTPSQLESIRAARLQLLDLGDEKTARTLDWVLTEPERAQRGNEREAFIKWMCETYPHAWPREDAESAWDNRHVAALAWLARAAHALANDSADREHAQAYLRQAEQLLTGNEATLHAENQRLREQLKKES